MAQGEDQMMLGGPSSNDNLHMPALINSPLIESFQNSNLHSQRDQANLNSEAHNNSFQTTKIEDKDEDM